MKIYLECKPDEKLMMALGITRKEITHANDKGRVCNYLKNSENCIGLIDEDPGKAQPSYLSNLPAKKEKHGIKVLVDKKKNNTVIVLCPYLEAWVVNTAKKSKVDPGNFGLPGKAKDLHKVINYRLSQFNKLISALEEQQNKPLLYLKSLLQIL